MHQGCIQLVKLKSSVDVTIWPTFSAAGHAQEISQWGRHQQYPEGRRSILGANTGCAYRDSQHHTAVAGIRHGL